MTSSFQKNSWRKIKKFQKYFFFCLFYHEERNSRKEKKNQLFWSDHLLENYPMPKMSTLFSKNYFFSIFQIEFPLKSESFREYEALLQKLSIKNQQGGHFVPPPARIGLRLRSLGSQVFFRFGKYLLILAAQYPVSLGKFDFLLTLEFSLKYGGFQHHSVSGFLLIFQFGLSIYVRDCLENFHLRFQRFRG